MLDNEAINICLGDLFDSYQSDGLTLMQGKEVAEGCRFILGGNHDFANRKDTLSYFEVLMRLFANSQFESTESNASMPSFASFGYEGVSFCAISHKFTQDLFNQSLLQAADFADQLGEYRPCVLLLHCNYDSPFANSEDSLNLTKAQASALLESFDYILIGHEHIHRKDFDGRLVLLGNTHPTSFADISDKFCWEMEIEDGVIMGLEPLLIWNKEEGYRKIQVEDLLAGEFTLTEQVEFVEVVGQTEAKNLPAVSRLVADLWRQSEHLFMVRNAVSSLDGEIAAVEEVTGYEDVPSRISHVLEGTELQELWHDYLNQIEA